MGKTWILCNPISGGGRGRRRGRQLHELLLRDGQAAELFVTGKAGDARERAAALDSDVARVVVVGGDGTLNEVINGLREPARVPLTQLATGTANLLAHELGLPGTAPGVLRLLAQGTVRRLDVGRVGDRRFLLVVSAGFDAMVTLEAQRGRTGPTGYSSWLLPVVRVLRRYRPPRLGIRVDHGAPLEGQLVVVSNVRNYGGIFTVADRARCDSGHLDVCLLGDAGRVGLLRAAIGALRGGLSNRRGVSYRTGSRIEIFSDEPVAVEVDGDPFGTTPVEVTVEPRVLPVIVP